MSRLRHRLRGPRPEAVPVLVGRACALVGVLDIAAGVFPRFRHSRMHAIAEVLPGALGPFAAALSLSTGVLLLLLAHGLKRGKRRAWRAAVVLLPAGAVAQFTYRHSIVGVLISLALLAPLLLHRDQFSALPDPRSRWRALANFVLMSAGSLLLGLLIVSVHAERIVGDPSLADRLTHVLYGLFGFEGPVTYQGDTSWTVAFSLGALGLLTAVTTIYLAFRPEHPAAQLTEEDETRLRALLERHGGRDSLGHFALPPTTERARAPLPADCDVLLPLDVVRSLSSMPEARHLGIGGGWSEWGEARYHAGNTGCHWGGGEEGGGAAATVEWVRDGRWAYERMLAAGTSSPLEMTGLGSHDAASIRCDENYGPSCAVDLAVGPDWLNVRSIDRETTIAFAEAVLEQLAP